MLCAALVEITGAGLAMVRILKRKVEAADDVAPEEVMSYELVSRSLRRTVALTKCIIDDSRKTPEQRAAEQLRREADQGRRAEAAEQARLEGKRDHAKRSVAAVIKREACPSDREYLLADLHERLLHPDIDTALRREDVSAVAMRVPSPMTRQIGRMNSPMTKQWARNAEETGAVGNNLANVARMSPWTCVGSIAEPPNSVGPVILAWPARNTSRATKSRRMIATTV